VLWKNFATQVGGESVVQFFRCVCYLPFLLALSCWFVHRRRKKSFPARGVSPKRPFMRAEKKKKKKKEKKGEKEVVGG